MYLHFQSLSVLQLCLLWLAAHTVKKEIEKLLTGCYSSTIALSQMCTWSAGDGGKTLHCNCHCFCLQIFTESQGTTLHLVQGTITQFNSMLNTKGQGSHSHKKTNKQTKKKRKKEKRRTQSQLTDK